MASVANAAASISKPNVIACSLVGITLSLSHEWLMQTDIELSSTADKMSELDYLLATLKVVLSPCVAAACESDVG
jgi:hypothetical protein